MSEDQDLYPGIAQEVQKGSEEAGSIVVPQRRPGVLTGSYAALNAEQKIMAQELLNTRRRKCWELKKAGLTYAKIGEQMGLSTGQASKDVADYAARLHEEEYTEVVRHRVIEAERLENLVEVLWPRVMAGDYAAMDMLLKIQTRKAKLLGLDSPTKFEHKIKNESRPQRTVSQEELDRRLLELYDRMKSRGVPISPLFHRWAEEKKTEG